MTCVRPARHSFTVSGASPSPVKSFPLCRLSFQLSTAGLLRPGRFCGIDCQLFCKSFVCRFPVHFRCNSFIYRFYAFAPGWEGPHFPDLQGVQTFRPADLFLFTDLRVAPPATPVFSQPSALPGVWGQTLTFCCAEIR